MSDINLTTKHPFPNRQLLRPLSHQRESTDANPFLLDDDQYRIYHASSKASVKATSVLPEILIHFQRHFFSDVQRAKSTSRMRRTQNGFEVPTELE